MTKLLIGITLAGMVLNGFDGNLQAALGFASALFAWLLVYEMEKRNEGTK